MNEKKTVAIFFASSNDELEDLVKTQKQFEGISTVLVLPNDNVSTFQQGMLFHPLYFVTKEDNPRHLSIAIDEVYHIFEDSIDRLQEITR